MELAKEERIDNEDKLISEVFDIVRKSMEKSYPQREMLRRFHPKSLGLVEAELIIENNIPESLRIGLFTTPRTYKAWIRFSNASPKISRDKRKTPRGMAIKVMDVSSHPIHDDTMGQTQDFVLTTNEILFPGTVKLYLQSLKGLFGNFLYLIPIFLNPFNWGGVASIFKGMIKVSNVLEQSYFSATPYLFGEGKAVKWHVRPLSLRVSKMPKDPEENFLTRQLVNDLAAGPARFELFAQQQTHPEREPIEDSSVRWKTPLTKLATLVIPRQTFDTPERRKLSESMTFSPWHCLPEHHPLGGNNRVRRVLYNQLAKFRNRRNGVGS